MYVFETLAGSAREAERVTCAFYRFLEQHSEECVEHAALHIERGLGPERISIRLWSEEAVAAYTRQLSSTATPPPPEYALAS